MSASRKLDTNEREVVEILEKHKIPVTPLHANSIKKTPDFLVDFLGERILMELKTKITPPEEWEAFSSTLEENGKYIDGNHREDISTFENSSTLNGGHKQLAAEKNIAQAKYCFVVFYIKTLTSKLTEDRIISRIYGAIDSFYMKKDKVSGNKRCLYYGYSDFYNHKSILDGIFIATPEGKLTLYVNNISENYESLSSSKFIQQASFPIFDPSNPAMADNFFVMDGPTNQKDEDAVINYLKDKYSLLWLNPFYMKRDLIAVNKN